MKIFIVVVMSICFFSNYSYQKKEEIKTLVILNGVEKMWTQKEKNDSINYSKVKSINFLTDSIARIKQYGEKAKYGVLIVTYKGKSNVQTIGSEKPNLIKVVNKNE